MRCSLSVGFAAVLLAHPGALVSQTGTMIWTLRGDVPDTVQSVMPGAISRFDLTFTVATDGTNLSATLAPGPDMIANSLQIDLSTVRAHLLTRRGSDSLTVGVVLPPQLGAMMGTDIGFELTIPLPDSLPLPPTLDSLETNVPAEYTNTGRTDTVAGVPCEIWTATTADPTATVEFCVAEPQPIMTTTSQILGERFGSILARWKSLNPEQAYPFGGRDMVPLRTRITGTNEMTIELTGMSTETPPPTTFQLPAGLQPFPMEMLKAATAAPATGT